MTDRNALKTMDAMPCGHRVCKRCLIANTMKTCPECHGYCHSNAKLCTCGNEFNIKQREPRKPSVKPEIPSKLCDVLLTVSVAPPYFKKENTRRMHDCVVVGGYH
jgi:hypothetical protein